MKMRFFNEESSCGKIIVISENVSKAKKINNYQSSQTLHKTGATGFPPNRQRETAGIYALNSRQNEFAPTDPREAKFSPKPFHWP